MRKLDLEKLVLRIISQDFSVCYIDSDAERRASLAGLAVRAVPLLKILEPKLSGYGMIHYNVVIAVNDYEFPEDFKKEYQLIAGACDGNSPCVIRIDI